MYVSKRNQTWRTFITVIDISDDQVTVRIPSWKPDIDIKLKRILFPPHALKVNYYFFAKVNTDVEDIKELKFSHFEFPNTEWIDRFKKKRMSDV